MGVVQLRGNEKQTKSSNSTSSLLIRIALLAVFDVFAIWFILQAFNNEAFCSSFLWESLHSYLILFFYEKAYTLFDG